MTTAPPLPPRAPGQTPPRPGPVAPQQGAGVTLDPVRLLKQYWPYLGIAAIVGAVLGFVANFVLLRVAPVFKSSVMYTVSGERVSPGAAPRPESEDDTMRFMGTQVQFMRSDTVLNTAARDPDVRDTAWAQQYVVDGQYNLIDATIALSETLSARVLPQTNLIEMTLKMKWKEDVAVIVTAVSDAYLDDLKREGRGTTAAQREALSGLLRKNESDRLRLQREIERVLEEKNVDDLDVARGKAAVKVGRIQTELVGIDQNLAASRARMEQLNSKVEVGNFDPGDDLREAARNDPVVSRFESSIALNKASIRSLKEQGIGDEHYEIQRVRAEINAIEQERNAKFQEILRNLFDAQVESTRNLVSSLEAEEEKLLEALQEASLEREDLVRIAIQIGDKKGEIQRLSIQEQETQAQLDNLEAISKLADADRVRLIRAAQPPDKPIFPQIKLLMPAGVLAIGGLVGGLIVLRELLDQRIKGPADVGMIPRLRVLGMIPQASDDPARPTTVETAFRDTPSGVITESIRQIRAPLLKRMDQEGLRSLVVVGGLPSCGATSVVTNLSLSCAAGRERVLVIDANLRKPNVHNVFGLASGPGLGDVLSGAVTLDHAVQATTTDDLFVLAAGSAEHRTMPEQLSTSAMRDLLEEAKSRYDRVIVDAPPAVVSGDGVVMANHCDASIMVIKAMNEKRGLVARIRTQLEDTSSRFYGVVINAVQTSAGGYFKGNIKATHEYREDA